MASTMAVTVAIIMFMVLVAIRAAPPPGPARRPRTRAGGRCILRFAPVVLCVAWFLIFAGRGN